MSYSRYLTLYVDLWISVLLLAALQQYTHTLTNRCAVCAVEDSLLTDRTNKSQGALSVKEDSRK